MTSSFKGFAIASAMLAAGAIGVAVSEIPPVATATQPSPADLIVVNGRVFTGAGNPVSEAVAVKGDMETLFAVMEVHRPQDAADSATDTDVDELTNWLIEGVSS